MAGIPDAIERRTILYGQETHKKTPDYEAYGDMYREDGRVPDALECYERIPDEARRAAKIEEVRAQALEDGDHFLLNRVDQVGKALSEDEWRQAAEKAEAAGKLMYALKSARRGNATALVEKLEKELGIDRPKLEGEGETPEGETNETPPPSEGGEASAEADEEAAG